MNREQMIAWLAIEGWEWTGRADGSRREHIIRHKHDKEGAWHGDCVVLYKGEAVYHPEDGIPVSGLNCTYGGFEDASTVSITRFYNKLQEKDHAS